MVGLGKRHKISGKAVRIVYYLPRRIGTKCGTVLKPFVRLRHSLAEICSHRVGQLDSMHLRCDVLSMGFS